VVVKRQEICIVRKKNRTKRASTSRAQDREKVYMRGDSGRIMHSNRSLSQFASNCRYLPRTIFVGLN